MSTYIVIPRRSPIAASFHRPLSEDDKSNVLAYQRRTNRDLLVSAGMSAEELTDGIYFRPAGSGDDEKLPPRSLDALGVLLIDDLANSHITALQASGATVVKNVEVEGTDLSECPQSSQVDRPVTICGTYPRCAQTLGMRWALREREALLASWTRA